MALLRVGGGAKIWGCCVYIYQSHMSGVLYTSEAAIDTYCEQCGDSDRLIGYADNAKDAQKLMRGIVTRKAIDELIKAIWG